MKYVYPCTLPKINNLSINNMKTIFVTKFPKFRKNMTKKPYHLEHYSMVFPLLLKALPTRF